MSEDIKFVPEAEVDILECIRSFGKFNLPHLSFANDLYVSEDYICPHMDYDTTESVVQLDWENGFVETSAKNNENVIQVFKELLIQAKITYNLSPALRRRRRQSLPPSQMGSSCGPSTSSGAPPSASHVPSPAQLQHLQKIQERGLGDKRNSCIIS